MDREKLWQELVQAIRQQEPSGGNPNEFLVYTQLQQRRCNRITLFDDHMVRLSDGASSVPQVITKADVATIASWAVDSPDHQFSIKNPKLNPARMGSIVCTMLALLPYFEYLPGQVLVYKGP